MVFQEGKGLLEVNILTNLAYNKREISVFGGNQLRPNINIHDMCRSYIHILNCKTSLVNGEIFNVGYENQTVEKLAKQFQNVFLSKLKLIKFQVMIIDLITFLQKK